MKTFSRLRRAQGSALIVALIVVGVLIALGATSFIAINNRYRAVHQAGSWHEALLTAEAGVDMALTEIRKNLKKQDGSAANTPFHIDRGWETSGGSFTKSGDIIVRLADPNENDTYVEGERFSTIAEIEVDTPATLVDPATKEQWYRVKVTGICNLPGNRVLGGERMDIRLRKFDFGFDRFNNVAVAKPRATRRIEAIVKPTTAARDPMFGVKSIDLTDHNIVVDSYDSRDPAKSNNGEYPWIGGDQDNGVDETKRQWNGNISTNGTVINAGDAHIYGTASTHGGSVLKNENVTGNIKDYPGGYAENPDRIRNDFYREVVPVTEPEVDPSSFVAPSTEIKTTTIITASPGAPTQVKVPAINLSGHDTLTIRRPRDDMGNPIPGEVYAQIIVSGNLSVGGQGEIILEDKDVKVRLFVGGDTSIAGNGVTNPGSPLNFQLYGLDRPPIEVTDDDGTVRLVPDIGNITIAGNGGFSGIVYAPNYDIEMKGGGNADNIFGAFTGYTIKMTGVQAVHYDEALAEGSIVTGYNITSWFEDER